MNKNSLCVANRVSLFMWFYKAVIINRVMSDVTRLQNSVISNTSSSFTEMNKDVHINWSTAPTVLCAWQLQYFCFIPYIGYNSEQLQLKSNIVMALLDVSGKWVLYCNESGKNIC
jgi:hypothetical protein